MKKLREKPWYKGAVIACIGVAFYVLLTNWGAAMASLGKFIGYFRVVILGIVFAYIINPIARLFYYRVLPHKKQVSSTRWSFSVILAFLAALIILSFLLGMLIPQLVQSVVLLAENIDDYAAALINLIRNSPLSTMVDTESIQTYSENALSTISGFVRMNARMILNKAANSGKNVLSVVLSLIVAVYLLMDKKRVLASVWRLVRALNKQETVENISDIVLRCDTILMSYLGQTLLDSLIVGVINAVFMLICRMQYIGLISVIVAVTNLIPNFGPIIGAVFGGFILLLVNPIHALMFIGFCLVVQFFDAYILKPKLFSNSLGVSGLLILVASLVLGNMFGIIGMLLAIPASAILSFIYKDYYLPKQELRREQADAEENLET